MRLKKDSTKQKLRGAYYTPLKLADAIVNLFASENIRSILEPSCGDGVFLESLKKIGKIDELDRLTAVEIDDKEAIKVSENFKKYENTNIECSDFFDYFEANKNGEKYDLILGNPPYIRYQYLTERQRELQSRILTEQGMKSNKLINAWVAFIVACTRMLSDNGKIAFIIPAEILQVAYAEDLRIFLSNQFSKITLITFEKLVFPVEQEVVVFIGEKGSENKGIRIIEMKDLTCFDNLDIESNGFQKLSHVREKWTKYFIKHEDVKLLQSIREDNRFSEFAKFGVINVGITTGNNDFFSIDETTEKNYDLSNVTLPLIGRSSHAKGIYFTEEDHNDNVKNGKKSKLINFKNIPYKEYLQGHRNYISEGENQEENKGYKCSIRDRWYIIPSIWVPDAFFLRRNNLYPKFVLNSCNAVSTDTMHRIKFSEGVDHEIVLLSYYNSISFAFTEICGRSYGGGVLEILPSEVGNIMIPIINNIPKELKRELLEQVDQIIRNDDDIEKALDIIDEKLLINIMNVEPTICKKCRLIWKKMQNRRLKRMK